MTESVVIAINKTSGGITFSHKKTRQTTTIPTAKDKYSVDPCLNRSHTHTRLRVNSWEGQVHWNHRSHSITTCTESTQGKVRLMLLSLLLYY